MNRFVKFIVVGGTATLLQYLILFVLVEATHMLPHIASSIAYIISAIFNYLANYYYSFVSSATHARASTKFLVVVFIGLFINSTMVYFFTETLSLHYFVGQLFGTFFVTMSNYILLKNWAYK